MAPESFAEGNCPEEPAKLVSLPTGSAPMAEEDEAVHRSPSRLPIAKAMYKPLPGGSVPPEEEDEAVYPSYRSRDGRIFELLNN